MWQGLQTTDYKGKHIRELPSETSLPDELNYFYARFEANNTETCKRAPAVPKDCVITLSADDVSKTFKQVRKALKVVRTAQFITGAKLPAIQDLYTRRCQRKVLKIVKDSSHPSHRLSSLLPHGKRYRSAKSKRLLNSFYPQAIRLLNS